MFINWSSVYDFAIGYTAIGFVAGVLSTENCTALLLSLLYVLKNGHWIGSTVPRLPLQSLDRSATLARVQRYPHSTKNVIVVTVLVQHDTVPSVLDQGNLDLHREPSLKRCRRNKLRTKETRNQRSKEQTGQ